MTVSDSENLQGDPDAPISDSQAVAGNPTDESGHADEGPAGPNANNNEGDSTGEPVDRPATTQRDDVFE